MKYQIKQGRQRYKTVTKEEYLKWERHCGFRSKFPGEPACGSFGFKDFTGIEISGRIVRPYRKHGNL